ncbi:MULTISPECIES: N2,N2-dimethylguanosine tRNA methyltransferase [unclassified Synechococcus]|uniref:N2,N2-dimethylguanosine tRNA methyltransferase n=1 Tax=unclassified Synechococcus TaxID=2626047 RepID=UPI000319B8D9|nr:MULTISPECIES: N2,N2-dimethylguanosine tRNA methyltransferase [unclassified Synechococcus]WFN58732.1 N2,N2-dimethylguanosine tRNA methyltransferase [Synechococcus sp. CCFWC 502]
MPSPATGWAGAVTTGVGATPNDPHYCEGAAQLRLGGGFFRSDSRPARDLGVLLARRLAGHGPLRVLDLMAGCGVRSLRYGLEAGAAAIWANDADPERLPLLRVNLEPLGQRLALRLSAHTAQKLLADCLLRDQRFELVDLDAFGCPAALLPLALEAVRFGGVLYLASTDGRSPTGHDRVAALRSLGAAARAHPASWELALRLQLGVVARAAWCLGRGLRPLLNFSDGRTFRTAVQVQRSPLALEEDQLGLLAHCHGCGDQQVQSLKRLRGWQDCGCSAPPPLAVSGPLWIGPLQDPGWLGDLSVLAAGGHAAEESRRLLANLSADAGEGARVWPMAEIARRSPAGTVRLRHLLERLRREGWSAGVSGVMPGQLRTSAPWAVVLELAAAGDGTLGE